MCISYNAVKTNKTIVRRRKLDAKLFKLSAKNLKSGARSGLFASYPNNDAIIGSTRNSTCISEPMLKSVMQQTRHNALL
jgi:hypothetical protein